MTPTDLADVTQADADQHDRSRCSVVIVDLALDRSPAIHQHIWDVATPAEHVRATHFASQSLARRWLATRHAAKHVAAAYIGVPVAALDIRTDSAGRPIVVGGGCHVSISKSGSQAAIAVARTAVGVDIEHVSPLPEARSLAERFLHPIDAKAIAASSNPTIAFYRAWVRLEAALKCRGTGFDGRPPPPVTRPVFDVVENLDLVSAGEPWLLGAIAITPSDDGGELGPIAQRKQILPQLTGMQTIDEVISLAR